MWVVVKNRVDFLDNAQRRCYSILIMNAHRSRSFFAFAFANESRAATAETLCSA